MESFKLVVLLLTLFACAQAALTRTKEEIKEYEEYLRGTINGKPSDGPFSEKQYPWERSGKFEGDIILSESNIKDMVDVYSGEKNAVVNQYLLWPSKIVPYYVDTATFNYYDVNTINYAISVLNNASCVRFVPWSNQAAFVRIWAGNSGCNSQVGYTGTQQLVNLGPGCVVTGVVMHELLHAVGFYHMQSTYNRDDWVYIVWNKIQPGTEGNFGKLTTSDVTNLGTQYDYGSVMHYSRSAFSIDGSDTIIPRYATSQQLGQVYGLSPTDVYKLNKLYSCPGY